MCTVPLHVIRKSPTPSENRLTAILTWKKLKSSPHRMPALYHLCHHYFQSVLHIIKNSFYQLSKESHSGRLSGKCPCAMDWTRLQPGSFGMQLTADETTKPRFLKQKSFPNRKWSKSFFNCQATVLLKLAIQLCLYSK